MSKSLGLEQFLTFRIFAYLVFIIIGLVFTSQLVHLIKKVWNQIELKVNKPYDEYEVNKLKEMEFFADGYFQLRKSNRNLLFKEFEGATAFIQPWNKNLRIGVFITHLYAIEEEISVPFEASTIGVNEYSLFREIPIEKKDQITSILLELIRTARKKGMHLTSIHDLS
ncbi:hypothetical protein [Chondrinema litorale]|uniref:hypothetical protein n=1 Tax=Chondrinema litorale TaxID=2994555 RepID=UPI002543B5CF|nr:hypothetical protein [Chondrinema litorale]UZR96106.1 hypothetical protein OQ292_09835 [Chondrinema litorale]